METFPKNLERNAGKELPLLQNILRKRGNSCFFWQFPAKNVDICCQQEGKCLPPDSSSFEDEEDRNGDGDDDAAGAELGEILVAIDLVHHGEQTQSDCFIRRYAR